MIEHGCVTDQVTFETSCESAPAVGATITGAGAEATTGADGTAELSADAAGKLSLLATRGAEIPSKSLKVCVPADPGECPARAASASSAPRNATRPGHRRIGHDSVPRRR